MQMLGAELGTEIRIPWIWVGSRVYPGPGMGAGRTAGRVPKPGSGERAARDLAYPRLRWGFGGRFDNR